MKAPKSQRKGKKIPKKNINPCPFLSVMSPSVNAKMKYKTAPPIPIPHHIIPPSILGWLLDRALSVVPEAHGAPIIPTMRHGAS
jgi:hypothetical protein